MQAYKLILIFVVFTFINTSAQNVSVNNVNFQQRSDGTFFVDIYYDLTLLAVNNADVTIQASSDSGSTWTLDCNNITGAVGSNITAGNNKHIVWNFAADNANFFSDKVVIKVIADDGVSECGTSTITYEGKTYNTVLIGSQCWLKENLDVGTMIQGSQNATNNGVIEKYCYNNDTNYCSIYGGLYQWDEAMQYVTTAGTQGICPPDWHIPTNAELQTLESAVGNNSNALKAIGQGTGGGAGTNTSGFSALLAGYRDPNGNFYALGTNTYFWSSTEYNASNANYMYLLASDSNIYFFTNPKDIGFSVRCLKNETATSTLQLTSPNGGENWVVGTQQNITWTNTGVTNVKLEYTTNNGTDWLNIIESTPASTGSYTWIIPNTPTTKGKIRISDASYPAVIDTSNYYFAITSHPVNPCPETPTVTYQGKVYNTVQIGSRCWLRENLDVGVMIPGNQNQTDNSIIEKYCYDDNPENCELYGGLYQWDEAMQYTNAPGSQGLCPPGWHMPTQEELNLLENNGNYLKAVGQGNGAGAGNNLTDFSALLSGYRTQVGSFISIEEITGFWSSSYADSLNNTVIKKRLTGWNDWTISSTSDKYHGECIRCLKDEQVTTAINLNSPNGGEIWMAGSNKNIIWTSVGVSSIKLEYTTNNGTSWSLIVNSYPAAAGSYSWVIPNTPSIQCKVRISNLSNPALYDESYDVFTISPNTTIILISPNGGENWEVGSSQNIAWVSNNIDNLKLEYTINNGTSWIEIISSTPASAGNYSWEIPNTPSIQCKVRASDVSNSSTNDESNSFFVISFNATITLLSPNGGENWFVGTQQNITWTNTGVTNVKLEYTTNNGTDWTTIIASTPANTGSFAWTIPNTPSTNCKVRVSDASNSTVSDTSDAVFYIVPVNGIVYGGKIYNTVQIGTQTWLKENLDIGTMIQVSQNATNNGTIEKYCFDNLPTNCETYGGLYQWNEAMQYVTTPGVQGICPPGWHIPTNAELQTLSTAVGNNSNALKAIGQGTGGGAGTNTSGFSALLAGYRSNDGIFSNLSFSATFWSSTENEATSATSMYLGHNDSSINFNNSGKNYGFSVRCLKNDTPTATLQLTSPNGGENWKVGESYNITWTSSYVNNVKLEYSTNSGSNWSTISTSIPASSGSYSWEIPNTPSTNCKVRITDASSSSLGDTSNAVFTISGTQFTLTSPNGGEQWQAGSVHNITWNSALFREGGRESKDEREGIEAVTVKLEYTTNNGTNWTQITSSAPNNGSYSWTVPVTPSTACKVRISQTDYPEYNDESNAVFTIYQPTITVISPNGGENWKVGESYNITWTSSFVNNVKLEYSTNSGSNWLTISASIPASNSSYSWTVPNTPSAICKVRITDVLNSSIGDESNTVFTISATQFTLTSPNGGEQWQAGSVHNITWNSALFKEDGRESKDEREGTEAVTVKLEYTTNNGTNWTQITSSAPNNGSYSWTVSVTPSTDCKVRISQTDYPEYNDESNAVFTIYQPTITVTSPNGGENWKVGESYNITWTSSYVNNVKLEYSTNSGSNWSTISASIPASNSSYSWTVPNTPSTTCKVRITDASSSSIGDTSNAVFTISATQFTLTSPNGGEQWQAGSVHNITWNSALFKEDGRESKDEREGTEAVTVKLEYTTNNGTNWTQITSSAPNNGSYSWTVPNTPSENCRIRISQTDYPEYNDESDNLFTIFTPVQRILTLTSPNGGEDWIVGSTQNITWVSANIENIKIEYSTNGGTDWLEIITSTASSNQTYEWIIPNTLSTLCKVRLTDIDSVHITATSDDVFTISAQPVYSITVNSPNGGENWLVGSSRDITWSSSNISNVKLEYTTNNGTDWTTIILSVSASLGSYAWTVPNVQTTTCVVRISSTSNSSINDISNNVFTISPAAVPTVTLTTPNGDENWQVGSSQNITWTSSNVTNVKIEYTTDNGTSWNGIASNISAASGSHSWNIPSTPSAQCKVKVVNSSNQSILSQSSRTFTIFEYASTITLSESITFTDLNSSSYRMIGLPGDVNILVGNLLSGDRKTDWNVYYDNGVISQNTSDFLVEYDGGNLFHFKPGKAFWILSKNGISVSGPQNSVQIDADNIYSFALHNNWNLISNPFNRSVLWSTVVAANNITQNPLLYSFNGSWNNGASVMKPYEGYYFYNVQNLTSLKIPYDPNGSLTKENTFSLPSNIPVDNVTLKVTADGEILSKVFAAIDENASEQLDEYDYFAPPSSFENVSLQIRNEAIENDYKNFFVETRPMNAEGLKFDLELKNETKKTLSLIRQMDENAFDGNEVYLLDKKYCTLYNLRKIESIKINPVNVKNHLSLLIGSESFIEKVKSELKPESFELFQNYPNPFNPSTTIKFALPTESIVSLEVFNILGERIAVLAENMIYNAGYHDVTFNSALASGVYIYRIAASSTSTSEKFVQNKKMILLR